MIFLIIDGERYALSLGDTTLGGPGDDVLAHSPLADLSPFAVVTSDADGASIRALKAHASVSLRGQAIGDEAVELQHGDCLAVGAMLVYFGDLRNAGRTDHVDGLTDDQLARHGQLPGTAPTADTGGRLTALPAGRAFEIPSGGLVIGRDPDCGVVIPSHKVSRRHARVMPGLLGYSLTDDSTNGVRVNGARVEKSCLLSQGDLIQIGDEVFRFNADAASYEPDAAVFAGAPIPLLEVPHPPIASPAPEKDTGAPPTVARVPETGPVLLATLEVVAGTLPAGMRFRVERPVVQLGRDVRSDIRLADESVSGTHATLIQRNGAWQLIDLGSRNGTYVDDKRIAECVLQGPCEVRVGNVTLVFRPIRAASTQSIGTLGVFGLTDAQLEKRSGTR